MADFAPESPSNALPGATVGEAFRADACSAGVDLAWVITFLKVDAPINVDQDLIAAFQAASSINTLRALASDIEAFDLWWRSQKAITLPATSALVGSYLDTRAGQGARPASPCPVVHGIDRQNPRQRKIRHGRCGVRRQPHELRDRALLSLAYDTGLRAAELAAVAVGDVVEAQDPDARLLNSRLS